MHFEKIKSIKSIGKRQTYDICVPTYHNYILSNGIVSHNSGPKGVGKSSLSIWMAIKYLKFFGYKCPHCGKEFFKNLYHGEKDVNGTYRFTIPDIILNGKALIRCPDSYELDIKTGLKKKISGCGQLSKYSELKRIKWEAKRFIAYDNQDMLTKLFSLPVGSPLVADEAVNFASAQDFAKSESKELKKIFTVIRPKRFFIIFNIPEFTWLDQKYREGMSTFWFRVIERGTAIIFERDKGEAKEKYHLKELEKIFGVVKYFTDMTTIKKRVKKHPCYFDMVHFKDLPQTVYEDYELVRNARTLQRRVEEMEITNKDIAKIAAYNLLNNWDRIKIEVDKTKEYKLTYSVLTKEILVDPLTRKPLASETTIRMWVNGVREYLKSKGENLAGFDFIEQPKDKIDLNT